jgi:hypothetical protein
MNDFFLNGVNCVVNGSDVATELVYDDDITAPSDWDRVINHIVMSPLSFKETPSIDNDAPLVQARYNWHNHRKLLSARLEAEKKAELTRDRRNRSWVKKWERGSEKRRQERRWAA